mgnify:CR=1 FL=1
MATSASIARWTISNFLVFNNSGRGDVCSFLFFLFVVYYSNSHSNICIRWKEDDNNNKLDTRTDAEKAHEERSRQQRKKRILEHAELSHKDKVRLFNEKLGRLSEHHDIPKVGPG